MKTISAAMLMIALSLTGVYVASAEEAPKNECVQFTDAEKRELMNLLDVATKAGGLNAAQNALYFARKLNPAPQAVSPAPAETVPVAPSGQPEPVKPDEKK